MRDPRSQDDTPARESTSAPSAASPPGGPAVRPRGSSTAELLSRLWLQNLPLMRERVACLDRAAQQAAEGHLTNTVRTEAIDIAHKLAGSLGMFGFPRGTDVARRIEQMLESADPQEGELFPHLTAELRAVLPLQDPPQP